ncbi:MAG: sigma-54-dependent Fis family transcriptional regulator [Deltaproteobacteria bacterium]|nr:sigma-54-dependent Fis family transcriptional regulator [Deltaproteobacteria bacterium]
MKARFLIVDDKQDLAQGVALALEDLGAEIDLAHSGEAAIERLSAGTYDLVFSDIRMPGMDGLALLKVIKERWPKTQVVMFTAYGSIDSAVEAMRLGGYHYLTKPFNTDELLLITRRALKEVLADQEMLRLRVELEERDSFHGLCGRSRALVGLCETIKRVAPSTAPVMICGESGTGKELVARAIHAESTRASGRFLAFNAAAMPDTLAEAELFGARRGAYTGADRDRTGLFTEASGGTLFIDELGSMSLALQGKLLRVLQEGEVLPLGATRAEPVDVRVVSASNEDPQKLLRDGRLRQDLYYRLSVVRIAVPPLRERLEDVPLLAQFFLTKHATASGRPAKPLSSAATRLLLAYHWPGNVRELSNVIERALLLAPGESIGPAEIIFEDEVGSAGYSDETALPYEEAKARVVDQFQRRYIERVLSESNGNIAAAARRADITRAAFYKVMRKLNLAKGEEE